MPETNTDNRVNRTNGASGSNASGLSTKAFTKDLTLRQVAAGARVLERRTPLVDSVKTIQLALFSLNYGLERGDIDGKFGPKTERIISEFQSKTGIRVTGKIDADTVRELDRASKANIERLQSETVPEGSKRNKYHLVADIARLDKTSLYVIDDNNEIVARYLISPGTVRNPTLGDGFIIQGVYPRSPWIPPNSEWASGAQTIPAGLDNPMGILKLDLGKFTQRIHGVPAPAEAFLGSAASHGCVRMSGSNILDAYEKYAEVGTVVSVIRRRADSEKLEERFRQTGLDFVPKDAGRDRLFGYVSGELGKTRDRSSLPRNFKPHKFPNPVGEPVAWNPPEKVSSAAA